MFEDILNNTSCFCGNISTVKATIGCKAAIVCTSAGSEGQALDHFKYILNKKGFEIFLTDMVIYTYNWTQILNPQSKEIEEKVFKEADVQANSEIHKKLNHLIVGTMAFEFSSFDVSDNSSLKLIVNTPLSETDTEMKVKLLPEK